MRTSTQHARISSLAWFWDISLALGLLLAFETQLRFGDSPVGPGEILLLLWAGAIVAVEIARAPPEIPRAFWDVLRFWAALAASLCVGLIVTLVRDERNDWGLVVHDVAAYALLAALTCGLTILPDASQRLHRTQWAVALVGSALLLLQLANGFGLFTLGNIDPWYWTRFRGWTDNPNQWAPLSLLVGLLSFALAERDAGAKRKLVATICAAAALAAGFFGRSNAYSYAVVASLLLFGALKLCRGLMLAQRRGFPAMASAAAALSFIALSSILISPIIDLGSEFVQAAKSIGRNGPGDSESDDFALRVFVWKQAIERGGESWMLGFGPGPHGPGPHLPIPAIILAGRRGGGDEPSQLHHPVPQLAPNFESHNTATELFLQGGASALGLCLWIGALAIRRSWRAGADGLIIMLVAAAISGISGVVFRYPLVWFAVCLALTTYPRRPAALFEPSVAGAGENSLRPRGLGGRLRVGI